MPEAFEIQFVSSDSPLFESIMDLGGRNRRWLGFFPEGAFREYAAKKGLIAASMNGDLAGYMAVRRSRDWIHVTHLCVAPDFRRHGIGTQLVQFTMAYSERIESAGVRLKCRRDFPAHEFWERAGFVAVGEQGGRGNKSTILTIWRKRNCLPDLFSNLSEEGPLPKAVIDANVFFDLDTEQSKLNTESQCLLADWLTDAVELVVVDEIFNDLSRAALPWAREKNRSRARSFPELNYDPGEVERIRPGLFALLGWDSPTPQQRSDVNHLAKAVSGGANYFVTRDEKLLSIAPHVEERFEMKVVRPIDLAGIVHFEDQRWTYNPARFCGTQLTRSSLRGEETGEVASRFHCSQARESKQKFAATLRSRLSDSMAEGKPNLFTVSAGKGEPLVLYSTLELLSADEKPLKVLQIDLFRVVPGPAAATISRHLLLGCIQDALESGAERVSVTDRLLNDLQKDALRELSFADRDGVWSRRLIRGAVPLDKVCEELNLRPDDSEGRRQSLADHLEQGFWPLKILGAGIPASTIPIRPEWARQLFDQGLSEGELFPARSDLVLNRENVYYRSSKSPGPDAPSRLLWYVSQNPKLPETTGCIRACSRLLAKETAPAKELFKKFRRIGVYEWREVEKLTKGVASEPIMALHFSDTELFKRPVPLAFLREIGAGRMLQSPCRISEEQFQQIYEYGTN